MAQQVSILGFAGSLRRESFNRALLRASLELLPEKVDLEVFELAGISPFNQDRESAPPAKVREFKEKIKAAEGILIVTPEYNYSIPGVLKNAIDWASRPHGDNAFDGKPVAIMSASTGMLGGARVQYHLRQVFVFLNMYPLNSPEIFVTFARDKFDGDGKLVDDKARELIGQLLVGLADMARGIKQRNAGKPPSR